MTEKIIGTAESWVHILGYEGSYEISDRGRVRSIDRIVRYGIGSSRKENGSVRALNIGYKGCVSVALRADGVMKSYVVHRLVAKHFLPPSTLPFVRHKDGNRANNEVSNLYYSGDISIGKLSMSLAEKIRRLHNDGLSYSILSLRFGVSKPSIKRIVAGNAWRTS